MSKKTHEKSPGASVGKATRARPAKAAKTTSLKTRGPAASKASKNAKARQTGNPVAKVPHKPASKTRKLPGASTPVQPATTGSKAKAANTSLKTAGASAASRSGSTGPLAQGTRAPSFNLPRDGGGTVSLADYAGRKLVLFFYPRADTPGCTKEAMDFTRLSAAFAAHQIAVLGISADPVKAQEAFRNKHQLSIALLSDEKHEMLQAYGAWGEKSMYGRTFQGIIRTTVLVGATGRIVRVWRNVRVDGHADEVLAAAQAA
jgi:peroxiredoxin Q/BCP